MRESRAAKQERLEAALANIEREVERFGGEMRVVINSLRAELWADNRRGEGDQHD